MPRSALPLDVIRVASPCTASWDDMAGNDEARFCAQCQKHVYNLSAMSRRRAEEVILRKEGRLCVRFYRRHDGTVLTEDCPVGLRAVRRRLAWIVGLAASLLVVVLGVTAAFAVGRGRDGGTARGPFAHVIEALRDLFHPRPPAVVMGVPCPPGVAPGQAPPPRIEVPEQN